MNPTILTRLYQICLLTGFAVPILGLCLSGISNFFDLDLDLDGDTTFDAPIPVSPLTLSFAAVVFGATGRYCQGRLSAVGGLLLAACLGTLAGALLGRFVVRPLKRNRAYAQSITALKGREGVVKLELRSDFVGTIAVQSATGSLVTYSAKPAQGIDCIVIGTIVCVEEVDEQTQVCTVKPLERLLGVDGSTKN